MSQKKVVDWITVNGNHVPIFEGESKQDAVNRAIAKANEDKKQSDIAKNAKQVNPEKKDISYEEIQQKLETVYDKYSDDLYKKCHGRQFKGSNLKFDYYPGAQEMEFEKSLIYTTSDGKKDLTNTKTVRFKNKRELGKFLFETSANGGWPKNCVGYYDETKDGYYRVDKDGNRTLIKKWIK